MNQPIRWRGMIFAYFAMVAVPVVLTLVILSAGSSAESPRSGQAAPGPDPFLKLLFLIPLLLAACHFAGVVLKRLRQPPVIGEILVGLALGPSLLGAVWPAGFGWLVPGYLGPTLNTLAQIGLVLFMFGVGYQLDPSHVRDHRGAVVLVSHVGIALPFLSGVLLALAMYRPMAGDGVAFLTFALFLGVSMSITAFPVLARILVEKGLADTPLGGIALSCAAVDDVTAWSLLAVVVALVEGTATGNAGITLLLSAAFFLLLVFWLRPLLAKLAAHDRLRHAALPLLACGVLLSAMVTSEIGAHAIFGAFLFGVITPRSNESIRQAANQVHRVTGTLLLPLFFVYTGLRTDFHQLGAEPGMWLWVIPVLAVATLGKWVGAAVASRVGGFSWPDALSLGALMNCRGLTELVILNIGLDVGVISPALFAILVVMTLVSTALTSPALDVLARWRRSDRDALTSAGRPARRGGSCPAPSSAVQGP